jgi:hypothetical protein
MTILIDYSYGRLRALIELSVDHLEVQLASEFSDYRPLTADYCLPGSFDTTAVSMPRMSPIFLMVSA